MLMMVMLDDESLDFIQSTTYAPYVATVVILHTGVGGGGWGVKRLVSEALRMPKPRHIHVWQSALQNHIYEKWTFCKGHFTSANTVFSICVWLKKI